MSNPSKDSNIFPKKDIPTKPIKQSAINIFPSNSDCLINSNLIINDTTKSEHSIHLHEVEIYNKEIGDSNQQLKISVPSIDCSASEADVTGNKNKQTKSNVLEDSVDSWLGKETTTSNILRDCSDRSSSLSDNTAVLHSPDFRHIDSRLNIKTNSNDLIETSDIEQITSTRLPTTSAINSLAQSLQAHLVSSSTNQIKQSSYEPTVHLQNATDLDKPDVSCNETIDVESQQINQSNSDTGRTKCDNSKFSQAEPNSVSSRNKRPLFLECSSDGDDEDAFDDSSDDEHPYFEGIDKLHSSNRKYKLTIDEQHNNLKNNRLHSYYLRRLYRSFNQRILSKVNRFHRSNLNTSNHLYTSYEDKDLLTGNRKYKLLNKRKHNLGRTFRGSYKYSRSRITMSILKKLISFLSQKSTLALFGAFLIHITLGTVYTLSNINSYMTSYMRKHGSPDATYGGSMWISSIFAVGQGLAMILGGYIEKKYSARLSCSLGCALHSLSIIGTSWSIDYGPMAVLFTYGFLPGFGCGLAYMTPMSNGFGWFPNRKGLVAGIILAGFGIGTFIFNIAQTAIVNPDNLSPPENAFGYFTQKVVLDRVPKMFVIIGSIYATMQFIGCNLLFKPPIQNSMKGSDERPILVEPDDMSLERCVRRREFIVLFLVYGVITQGVLFVNAMVKEYGQIFIGNDMFLAWTGSMDSIANSSGRLLWGLAIDRFSFTQCFTTITIIFSILMFLMPFEFILSSKLFYLLCTLGIFGSFSGWMSTFPVHISRVFGRTNSGMVYGLIFISQSSLGILTAVAAQYLIDNCSRFVPFFCVVLLELLGLSIYHLFYPK